MAVSGTVVVGTLRVNSSGYQSGSGTINIVNSDLSGGAFVGLTGGAATIASTVFHSDIRFTNNQPSMGILGTLTNSTVTYDGEIRRAARR